MKLTDIRKALDRCSHGMIGDCHPEVIDHLLAVAELIKTCDLTLDVWEDPVTLEKESVEIPWGLWRDVQLALAALEVE